jgi:hypothetical protein
VGVLEVQVYFIIIGIVSFVLGFLLSKMIYTSIIFKSSKITKGSHVELGESFYFSDFDVSAGLIFNDLLIVKDKKLITKIELENEIHFIDIMKNHSNSLYLLGNNAKEHFVYIIKLSSENDYTKVLIPLKCPGMNISTIVSIISDNQLILKVISISAEGHLKTFLIKYSLSESIWEEVAI